MTITSRSIERHGHVDLATQMRRMPAKMRQQMLPTSSVDDGPANRRVQKRRARNRMAAKSRRRNR